MPDPYKIIEKFYPYGTESFHILINHSELVRDKALEIACLKPEFGADKEFLSEAAMLHDIGIYLCYAPDIKCFGTHPYVEHGFLGAEILRSLGFPKHALVCERHTGTGITKQSILERNLNIPPRDMLPVSIEEQIICYADKFFSKSHSEPNDVEKIKNDLARFGVEQVKRFEKWQEKFD